MLEYQTQTVAKFVSAMSGISIRALCVAVRMSCLTAGTLPPSPLLVHTSASCGSRHGAVTATASLNVVAVDTWCSAVVKDACVALFLSVIVDVFEVEGVDVTREEAIPSSVLVQK